MMFGFEDEAKAQEELQEQLSKYSRAGVISFLQQEWIYFEEEKEKWMRERAALKSHIDKLDKNCKVLDTTKNDLLKRIRMLEQALIKERAKTDPKAAYQLAPLVDEKTKESFHTPIQRPRLREPNSILQKYMAEFDQQTENLFLSFSNSPSIRSTPPSFAPGSRSQTSSVSSAASALAGLGLDALKAPDLGKPLWPNGRAMEEPVRDNPASEGTPDEDDKPTYPTIEKRRSSPYTEDQVKAFLQNKDKERTIPMSLLVHSAQNQQMEPKESKPAAFALPSIKETAAAQELQPKEQSKRKKDKQDSLGGLENLDKILASEASSTDSSSLGSAPATNVKGGKMWQPQFTLRHHLGVVRSVAFHEDEPMLVSASDDCTVKIWNWRTAGTVGFGGKLVADVEPIHTLIGHTGPVYSVALSSSKDRIFSAGADCDLRVWELPDMSLNDPYAERGKAINFDLAVLKGHTDAIWDVAFHPKQSLVLTASADETVKLWDFEAKAGDALKFSAAYPEVGKSVVATSICFLPYDLNKWVAGYTSSSLGIFDIESGKCVQQMHAQATPTHTADHASQINKVVSHKSLQLIITAHEDNTILFWDSRAGGEPVHKMVAHQAPVSSLAIDPTGAYLVSTDHKLSVRFWEISSKSCVQEITAHRQKYGEGIYCVDFHPRLDLMATGGADSCIKVYQ